MEDLDRAFDLWEKKKDLPPRRDGQRTRLQRKQASPTLPSVRGYLAIEEEEREGK